MEVIGEAARHIPSHLQERYPQVPWAEMRAMRNVLSHEYVGISLPILWQTITGDLPALEKTLREISQAEGVKLPGHGLS